MEDEFLDPNEQDLALAKAYGGEARGAPVRRSKMGSVSKRGPPSKRFGATHDEGGPSRINAGKGRRRHRKAGMSQMSGSDDGKLFDQDLSDFLGDSDDFDFESIAPPSRAMTR